MQEVNCHVIEYTFALSKSSYKTNFCMISDNVLWSSKFVFLRVYKISLWLRPRWTPVNVLIIGNLKIFVVQLDPWWFFTSLVSLPVLKHSIVSRCNVSILENGWPTLCQSWEVAVQLLTLSRTVLSVLVRSEVQPRVQFPGLCGSLALMLSSHALLLSFFHELSSTWCSAL